MKIKQPTKEELAIEALADIYRHFKLKKSGQMTRKAWFDFSNNILGSIEKILEHGE